ncbi:hypothetical protein H7H37_03760, partial [Mycolicibacterium insubricum]|nr:hypothetical protein [Mycolicibacterium insubricum]
MSPRVGVTLSGRVRDKIAALPAHATVVTGATGSAIAGDYFEPTVIT